jgi:hypothetical protein
MPLRPSGHLLAPVNSEPNAFSYLVCSVDVACHINATSFFMILMNLRLYDDFFY